MQTKIILYFILIIVVGVSFYLFFNKENESVDSNFIPHPAFSVLSDLPTTISSTSSISAEKILYSNETLGLSMELPAGIVPKKETAELQKYELGSGEDKFGQEYKYYSINFSNDRDTAVNLKIKEVPYTSISDWLEKDNTRGGDFPEDTVKFEQKNMFGENVLFGFDSWYKNYSTAEDTRSSEYAYVIKNGLLYKIEAHNLSESERKLFWDSIKIN
jgi:hypothetical protein